MGDKNNKVWDEEAVSTAIYEAWLDFMKNEIEVKEITISSDDMINYKYPIQKISFHLDPMDTNGALTIDEIRQLKSSDWVWLVEKDGDSQYVMIDSEWDADKDRAKIKQIVFCMINRAHPTIFDFSDYGWNWVVYRSKEQYELVKML